MLSAREKRCEDCACLISKNGKMCCDELWGRPCVDIAGDECPEEITLDEVEEITEKTKNLKIDHGAKAEVKKERKKVERKPDEEKEHLINCFRVFLEGYGAENVEITNKSKIVEFNIGENHYKLDLIRQRPPKKK